MLNFSQKEIDVLKKKKNVWKEYIWQRYRKWESLQQSLFSKMKIGPSANWKDYIEQDMEFSANFSTLLHKRGDLAATSRNTFESKDLFGWNFYKTKRGKGIFPFDRRHRVRQIFIVDCQLSHSERKILFNIFPGRDDIA